ncbi:phage protease [Rheinheimera sp.]|uniref:phage protease n=1 Tax=Rheinheimera sp. TaxID=1869214 RepID=UPI00307DBB80
MFSKSAFSIAVLSAATATVGCAVLTAELQPGDDWAQLLPDGQFSAWDGRPHDVPSGKWLMNAAVAANVIALFNQRKNDIVIDYEHQTLVAAEKGIQAPAAGWFNEMEYRPGQGLYIKPNWTPKAQAFIANNEYRYLSAVFPYDKTTGEVQAIYMAALTNNPGADGMEALASLAARFAPSTINPQEDQPMHKTLIALLAKLGVTVQADANLTDEQAQAALTALTTLETNQAALSAKLELAEAAGPGNIDLSQYVPIAQYNAALQQVASLTATTASLTVEQVIENAEKEGKLVLASERDYLVSLGKQNMAALTAQLQARPSVAALTAQQSSQVKRPDADDKQGVAALTADQKAIADQIGVSHADLAKELGVKA